MGRFLVRVQLADRPGALGAVASRIGAVRGDVVGVEILDRHAGRAVDEFLVELPDDAHARLLTVEIEEVDGAVVELVHPLSGSVGDARREAYEDAAAVLAARSPEAALQELAAVARRSLDAAWSSVVEPGPAAGAGAGAGASASAGAGVRRSEIIVVCEDGPAPAPSRFAGYPFDLDADRRLPAAEIAWAPMAAWDLALVVGRPGRRFLEVERERLVALAQLGDARWGELARPRAFRGPASRTG
jgi:hypothetical protein